MIPVEPSDAETGSTARTPRDSGGAVDARRGRAAHPGGVAHLAGAAGAICLRPQSEGPGSGGGLNPDRANRWAGRPGSTRRPGGDQPHLPAGRTGPPHRPLHQGHRATRLDRGVAQLAPNKASVVELCGREPMSSRREPRVQRVVLAGLLFVPVGLFAAWFGGWHAIFAWDTQYRLLSSMCAFAAITMVAAATCLFHPRWSRSYGREAATLAGAVGIAVGCWLLMVQLNVPEARAGRLPWSAAIVLASVGAVWRARGATRAAAEQLAHDADVAPASAGQQTRSRLWVGARLAGGSVRKGFARLLPRRGKIAHDTFDAFISYSHARDSRLAVDLKHALHRFARPWYHLRVLHVFVDNTNLVANPDLWSSIVRALERTRFLVLLASPEAARSPWVEKEISLWRERWSVDRILLVLTAGTLQWDAVARDFDWEASNAVPRALSGAFVDEPRWVDLRIARSIEAPSLRDPSFREVVADVAAPLHGRPRDELTGEDIRQHRRIIRVASAAVVLLIVLTVTAGIAAGIAMNQRDRAEAQLRVATSRFLASEARMRAPAQHSQSLLLSLEALDMSDTAEARSSLYEMLARSPQVVRYLQPQTGFPWGVAFSPDGRTLAVAASDGAVELWSVHDGRRTRRIDVGEFEDIKYVNARMFALISDGRVRLVDPNAGEELARLESPAGSGRIKSVAVGGGIFATGDDTGRVVLWNSRTRRPLGPPLRHHFTIDHVALASDGHLLVAAGTDGEISVWQLDGHPRLAKQLSVSSRYGDLHVVALSPDGKHLAAGMQDGTLLTWNVADWSRRSVALGGSVNSVAFSADGKLLATGDWDGVVRLWDAQGGKPVGTPLKGHIASVGTVTFAPIGQTLASSGGGNVILWEPLRKDRLTQPYRGAEAHKVSKLASAGAAIARVQKDGRLLLSDSEGTHELLPAKSGQEERDVAFSPDGGILAATVLTDSYKVAAVQLWHVSDRRAMRKLESPDIGDGLSFSSDGRTLATGGGDRGDEVLLWNTASGDRIGRPLRGERGHRRGDFALSPTGYLLAIVTGPSYDCVINCAKEAVELWDWRKGKRLARLEGVAPVEVLDVNFSPDGRTLGTGDIAGNLLLWEVPSGRRLGEPLTGHTTGVAELTFSRDGRLAATTGGDGSMLLWDLDIRRQLGPTLRGSSPVFSPDGRSLWSLSNDGDIFVRSMDVASWRRLACSLANRNLGPREWEQFLADVKKYQPTCPGRDRGRPAEVGFRGD